jgi:hypothetical protein
MLMVLTVHEELSNCLKTLASLGGRGALKWSHCSGSADRRKMKAERSPDSNAERVERWTELAEVCINSWQHTITSPVSHTLHDVLARLRVGLAQASPRAACKELLDQSHRRLPTF